jgi:hypothetical protein
MGAAHWPLVTQCNLKQEVVMKVHYQHRKSALAAALLLALGGAGLAHSGGAGKTGGSAEVGKEAVKPEVKQGFTGLDRDADGYLSEQEFKAMGHPDQAFKDADIDGDKRVSLTEYVGHAESKWMGTSKAEEPKAAAPMEKSAPEKPKSGGY